MLWTITIILFVLWILGLVSSYTLGGWIHILLVLAIIVLDLQPALRPSRSLAAFPPVSHLVAAVSSS